MTRERWIPVIITFRGGPVAGQRVRDEINANQPVGSTTYELTFYRGYNTAARTRAVYAGLLRTSTDTAVIDFKRIETY